MKLSQFNYNLPKKLIAQKPASPRDRSKLMVYDSKNDQVYHKKFQFHRKRLKQQPPDNYDKKHVTILIINEIRCVFLIIFKNK